MKKIEKILIALTLLVIFNTTYSQNVDLNLLEGLAAGISNSQSNAPLTQDDANNEDEIKLMDEKNPITLDFSDENYGYTGPGDFTKLPNPKKLEAPLKYFGYDFFLQAPSTFLAATNIPVSPNYIIGPGDNLKIYLYGNVNRQFTVEVSREGELFFPDIGPVYVAGMTFDDVKEILSKIVANQIIGTEINITLGSLRSINIFVMGEAYQPGMYTVSSLSTLTNAIFASGGINSSGSLRNIQLKRNGQTITDFDFYDVLLNGDTSKDIRLMPGDVVFIPPVNKTIGISGEVSRPGIYELKKDESIKDLIKFSGNLKPKAGMLMELERIDQLNNGFKLINIDPGNINAETFTLLNGDILRVLTVTNTMSNAVLVSGHFQQPR